MLSLYYSSVSCHPVIGSWVALVRSYLFVHTSVGVDLCPVDNREDLLEAYGLAHLGGNIPALLIPSPGDITRVWELVPLHVCLYH